MRKRIAKLLRIAVIVGLLALIYALHGFAILVAAIITAIVSTLLTTIIFGAINILENDKGETD